MADLLFGGVAHGDVQDLNLGRKHACDVKIDSRYDVGYAEACEFAWYAGCVVVGEIEAGSDGSRCASMQRVCIVLGAPGCCLLNE